MPIPAGDINRLRSLPQYSHTYLVVQQPMHRVAGAWTGYVWSGRVTAAVGATDPIISITVTSNNAIQLYDGMTIFIGSTEYGAWDRGVVRKHGDQNIGAGAQTLYIAVSSDLRNVIVGDYVVVLNEWRLWPRFPKSVVSGENITFYKDYGRFVDRGFNPGLLWDNLGANDVARRLGSMPPVPIMGPHRVAFIDPGGSVNIDYDWSDSYAMAPGAAVTVWAAYGQNGGIGWNSAAQNPGAQNFTNISGLAGYRTLLQVSDGNDAPVEFRSGYRFVFTLRRPGQTQAGDPPNAEPIVDFEFTGMRGDFDSGKWSCSVRVWDEKASEYSIMPGTLVIIFADDYYRENDFYKGTDYSSVGPITGCENILMIGHVADGTITHDDESGEWAFQVVSLAEQASRRDTYSVPIEDYAAADSWLQTPSLTVARAAHHYLCWHSNMIQVADVYTSGLTQPIKGYDFVAGDLISSSLSGFLHDYRFARILVDRFERVKMVVDAQYDAAGAAATLFTLQDGDWLGEINIQEVYETPVNFVEGGGVVWDSAFHIATPYLSAAPGSFSKYLGKPTDETALAIATQADLNTLTGRHLANMNNKYPRVTLQMGGNWRVGDIWPQEYVILNNVVTKRHTFANVRFFLRGIAYDYDREAGAIFATFELEAETDGEDGVTVPIDGTLPVASPKDDDTPPDYPEAGYIPPALDYIVGAQDGGGIHYSPEVSPPVWTDLQNDELVATGSRTVSVMTQLDWGNDTESLFALCYCGFYEYRFLKPSQGSWIERTRNYEITNLAGAAATDGYFMMDACYSPNNPGHAWCLVRAQEGWHPLGRTYRLCCAHTHDGWQTLEFSNIILTEANWNSYMGRAQIRLVNDGTDAVLYISCQRAPTNGGELTVKKSTDGGATWVDVYTLAASGATEGPDTCLYLPPSNNAYVYAAFGGTSARVVRSINAGGAFASLGHWGGSPVCYWMTGPSTDEDIITLLDYSRIYEYDAGWSAFGPANFTAFYGTGIRPMERTAGGRLVEACVVGYDSTLNVGKIIKVKAGSEIDITENWNAVATAQECSCISWPEFGEFVDANP